MNKHTFFLAIITFLGALAIGAAALTFWVTPYLFEKNTRLSESLVRTLSAASLLTYGTVVNTDTTRNTITIRVMSRFQGSPDSQFFIYVDPTAYIARQELQPAPDGTYVALSAATESSLTEIRPGDHVAVLFGHREDNALSTGYILYGNPL